MILVVLKNVCLSLFVEVKALLGLCYMLYNIRHNFFYVYVYSTYGNFLGTKMYDYATVSYNHSLDHLKF